MTTTGNERHLRMVFLLVKGGTEMTKRLFEKRVVDLKPINHTPNTPWTVDEFLYQNKDLILSSNKGREKETVYFPGPCDKTDLSKWDLIMFCFILTRICNLSNSILKDVEELRDMRNKICHVTDPTLEESKFEKKLRNFKVIAERICKDINDASFEKHINELIDNIKTDPLSTSDIVKMTHKFYTMERETKAILTEHTKDHQEMIERLTRIESKLDNTTSANVVKLPETDVEILVQNCNKDKEKKLSQILVKLIDEKIQERTDLVEELSNEDMAKLREAVAEAVEMFLTNGRKITSTENKCVLVRVQCLSVGSLAALFRDCISGELTNQLKPIEKAIRGLKGYEEVNLVAIIYEGEFWKVMRKTISVLEDYVQSEENKPRAVVSMQCAQAASRENEGTPLTLNIHYPSSVQRDILREAFTKGEIDRRMKKIQDAVGPEYSNVKITARLKQQVELSPEVYYASTKRCTKRVKKKRNGKGNKGTLSEMVSSMMISKSDQKTKEETDDLKSCSGEGDTYSVEDVTTMVYAEGSDFSIEAAPVLSSFWDRTSDTNNDSGTKMILSYSDTDKENINLIAATVEHTENESLDIMFYESETKQEINIPVSSDIVFESSSQQKYSAISNESDISVVQDVYNPYEFIAIDSDIDSGIGTGFPHTDSDSDTGTKQIALNAECEGYAEYDDLNSSRSEGDEEMDFNFECDVKSDLVQQNEDNDISVKDENSRARNDHYLLENGIKLNNSYLAQFKAKTAKHAAFYEQFFDELTLNKLLSSQPDKFIRGIIYLEGAHEAVCVPTNLQYNFGIHISGRSKIGQAYNQDEVVVELLDKKARKEIRFGKVVGVLHRQKNIKHPVFLCTQDDVESHIVRPMCKTVPKIHVIQDKLKQTRTNPRARKNRIEIYQYFEQAEILCESRIEELLPTEIESCVFLVALISWELNQIYPRGAIIRKLPRGDTIETGLAILNLRYGIMSQLNGDDHLSPHELNDSEEIKRKDLTYLDSFTIDRTQCKDFNYAFSVENKNDGYIVGVHVVDVAAYVTKGSPLDKNAQMLSRTICSDVGGPRYMLPVDIAENLCSLTKDETKPTISFFFFLGENGRQMQIEGRTFKMERTFIKCRRNFSYAEALQMVEMVDSDDTLSFSLKRMFELIKQRRTQRLGVSMYTLCDYEINKDEMEKGSILAQCIVEELIIMVNEQVAKVLDRNKICLPFYIDIGPSANDSEKFLHKYKDYLNVVVKLQQKEIVTGRRVSLDDAIISNSETDVIETRSLWERMKMVQLETARCTLLDDNIHPLQCVIYQEWLSIQQKPCYVTSNTKHAKNLSIGVEKYTHCTSPSRRYTDLVVQRLLHAYIANQQCPYSEEEISSICLQSNSALNVTSDYERDIRSLTAAVRLKSETKLITCFVKEVSDKNVTVIDTSDYNSRKKELDISFNLLDMGYRPIVSLDSNTNWTKVQGTWRKRFYDMTKYVLQGEHIPKSKLFVPRKQTVFTKNRVEPLDPNRNLVFIKLQQYANLLKSASSDHIQDLKRKLRRTNAKEKPDGVKDISTELTDHSEIMANTMFSHTFVHAQPVILQLTSEPHQGIIMPKPMVFQMTKTINLCLLHTEDPVLHLEHYETRLTQDQYNSVQHYSDTWLPIVLMEASSNAISNEDSCNINNITLQCITNQTGSFQLPIDFCEERNIKLSGTVYKIDSDDDDSKHSYDWLCIKYTMVGNKTEADEETDASVWIGHARITEIIEIAHRTLSVKFQLHDLTNKFPHEMLKLDKATVSVEVLSKTDVDRRIESYLRRFCLLEDKKEPVSVKIALKKKFHALDKNHRKVAEMIERDLYFSVESDDPRRKPLPRNNRKQQEAIDYALRNRFTLIQGPPGTGKTYTGIKLIYLFNKINNILSKEGNVDKQVLFCGPSNKSVDLVAKWMLRRLGNYCPDFVRVYGKATESLDFPIPGVSYSSRGSAVHRADEELQDVTLHFLIRRRGNKYAKEINETDAFFKQFQQTSSNESKQTLREEFTRRHLNETIKEYKKIVNKASKEELKKHRVILCTTGVGSNPVILQAADIYQVIVDEAGMCPEPQCMVPLIATKAEQVVLIGDHKQLRPIVKCKAAAELGLDKSLFERYATMKDCPAPFIMLDEQYRMNPALCEFPSKQFYDGKLMTMPGLWKKGDIMQIWPKDSNIKKKTYPHILIHIEGEEQVLTVHTDEGNEQSRSNSKEIKKVLKVYRYFIEEGVGAHTINIISQYNAQCAAIRDELKEQGFTNYVVNTVVSSQGGEWDYVIFSTVRSLPQYKIEVNSTLGWRKHNLGFITDKNQINVALTRARKGLIIIGNKNLLSCDPVWKKLVSHYEQRQCVKLPKDFPPPPRSRQQRLEDSRKRSRELFGQDNDDEQF